MLNAPLIVTLLLDENAAQFFNGLRTKHFPPERNHLAAHLTLFHHLPSDEPKIREDLQRWSLDTKPLLLNVTDVVSIGKGVAYKIGSADLLRLHKMMQREWQPWLTPQDGQKLWPHVTVQNKVAPAVAKETLQLMQASFRPFTAHGLGFGLWSYEGGPWRFAQEFKFQ